MVTFVILITLVKSNMFISQSNIIYFNQNSNTYLYQITLLKQQFLFNQSSSG